MSGIPQRQLPHFAETHAKGPFYDQTYWSNYTLPALFPQIDPLPVEGHVAGKYVVFKRRDTLRSDLLRIRTMGHS